MFYTRLNESDVDGIDIDVETADDAAVEEELDNVEKEVAEEGIENVTSDSNTDEDPISTEDPVDESMMIVCESEINLNNIMRVIGINEVAAEAKGYTIMYEAVDIKGFFNKVKQAFLSMFKRIAEFFKKVLAKLDLQVKMDNAFIKKHSALLKSIGGLKYEYEGFNVDIPNDITFIDMDASDVDIIEKYVKSKSISKAASKGAVDELKTDYSISKLALAFGVNNCQNSISDFASILTAKLIGVKKVQLKGKVSINKLIVCLSGDKDTTRIKDLFAKSKKAMNDVLKKLNKMEAEAKKKSDVGINIMNICQAVSAGMKTAMNMNQTACGIYIKAAKIERSQYRAIAHLIVSKEKKNMSESGSIFDAVELI